MRPQAVLHSVLLILLRVDDLMKRLPISSAIRSTNDVCCKVKSESEKQAPIERTMHDSYGRVCLMCIITTLPSELTSKAQSRVGITAKVLLAPL